MKRRIALLYIGKSINLRNVTSSHYPTIRSVINILLEDPDNEITILSRHKLMPSMELKVRSVPINKYDVMYQTQEEYDKGLLEFLQLNAPLEYDVVLVFGELGLGDTLICGNRYSEQKPVFNKKYYATYRSTLHYIYMPLRILDFISFRRIYFVGQDKDFIGKYPPYEDQSKFDKTFFIDFNDEGITTNNTFGGYIPELMAMDFREPMNWVGLDPQKKYLFSAGYHVTLNRTDFVNTWLSKINDPQYHFHLKRANKKVQSACSHPSDHGVLKFGEMVQKIANSKYSLVIGTVNNSPKAWTIRQHMNWALGTQTFFTNNYDQDKILVHNDLDYLRVDEPQELMDKIKELEAKPELQQELWDIVRSEYLNPERFVAAKERWHSLIR